MIPNSSTGKGGNELPAVILHNILKFIPILVTVLIAKHVAVVAVMSNVLVLWYELNVEDSDIDSQSRLTVPVEVVRLSDVSRVVRCF